ncbi:CoA transferase [Amycolatopsis decaplanina]|uniref:L-carnitine dehydratase/bile acid-inducible protein F n=1 Tax=Amycolatopsis decaplanina DSM 44594 TaxID=1284240 RepID=M2YSB1_9PSEU|nr:CoA transferase [Amycolatopsis decaplanina]EME51199.1 L-carnitine dehydratase/bile acid-inducible protein F [Amycolatopsis decaplanina DSM 44594]
MTSALGTVTVAGPVDLPLAGELDVQAACGIMHVHGRRSGEPAPLGLDYASLLAAELAEMGAVAARLARDRGIPLRGVSTSLAQAALLAISQYLAAATTRDEYREELLPGGPPFRSSDGVAFEIETLDPAIWQRFWSELGADHAAISSGWRPFMQRFATATCPLPPRLPELLAACPIARSERAAALTGMTLVRVADRALDGMPAFVVSGEGRGHRPVRPVESLPLSGLVVLESCRRVQGPMAGHLLRLLGASVLRIEPPGGDPLRWVPPMAGETSARFQALNEGKEVVEIDLTRPEGRRQLIELAAGADVFLHNWAPGKAERWSLTGHDLARARPGIVYAHASGWGTELGPEPPVGTDFIVQAYAGVPRSLMTIVDVFGGIVSARGIVTALARGATRVDSSLLSAACRLNAGARRRSDLPLTVPVCDDLTALAADPRFSRALVHDDCVLVASPWRFVS